jgi:hypothetical protein
MARTITRRNVTTRVLAVAAALLATAIAVGWYRIAGNAIDGAIIGDFYTAPLPATSGTPGTIVRTQSLPGTPIGTQAWRVIYESTDLFGTPIMVSGLVISPVGPAPAEGRTVVSWGHPTTGTAAKCAPSLGVDPFMSVEGLDLLLARGYVVTYTDYLGLGVPGPNHYLIGATAGNTVLDAVRAAQAIPDAHAGTDVVLWGHSQGGQSPCGLWDGLAPSRATRATESPEEMDNGLLRSGHGADDRASDCVGSHRTGDRRR